MREFSENTESEIERDMKGHDLVTEVVAKSELSILVCAKSRGASWWILL